MTFIFAYRMLSIRIGAVEGLLDRTYVRVSGGKEDTISNLCELKETVSTCCQMNDAWDSLDVFWNEIQNACRVSKARFAALVHTYAASSPQ